MWHMILYIGKGTRMHVAHKYTCLHTLVLNFKSLLNSNAIGALHCASRGNDGEAYYTMTFPLILESGRMDVCPYEDNFSAVILQTSPWASDCLPRKVSLVCWSVFPLLRVIKCHNQKQLGEESVPFLSQFLSYTSLLKQVRAGTRWTETWRQEPK